MESDDRTLRKSAFGRTNLFLTTSNTVFREIRCSASSTTRQASASVFHPHMSNNVHERPENCVCWHCCHTFEGTGFRLPRIFDSTENVYHVYGWYCSANCAKAYILEHSTFDRGYQMNVFVRLLREVYGIDESVTEAPPRMALRMFGGPFDIETFRKQTNICLLTMPPFVAYCMLIEERKPIASMDEAGATATMIPRGSVRGLRRPTDIPSSSEKTTDDICGPEKEGMYAHFLHEHGDADLPATKRPRTGKKIATGGGGLAKFASVK